MTAKDLFRAIGDVDEDLVEAAEAARGKHAGFRPVLVRIAGIAAAVALFAGVGLYYTAPPPAVPRVHPGISSFARVADSPDGMRKFFNYGGYRYAFLQNGGAYDLSEFSLTDSLGTLEHDILAGMDGQGENAAATMDFATTYALGGEVFALPGYDPAFRLAVSFDGATYLADLVGRVDNAPLDAAYYFDASDLEALVRQIDIQDHAGGTVAYSIPSYRTARKLLRTLRDAQPAALTGSDYEAIARAQAEGDSWQLVLYLADGTSVPMYVTPGLGYVSIGDSTYVLPDAFQKAYGKLFDTLPRQSVPAYS